MAVALSADQQDALRLFAQTLAAASGEDVLEVRLFGSRARGDAKAWSDVDLLVVASDDAAADRIRGTAARLQASCWNDEFPGLVCVVLAEPDFRRHQAMRSLLYRDLRDQGIVLWRNGVDLWDEEGIPVAGRARDVRFHLDQAREALQGAKVLLRENLVGRAASNAYYPAFHAASAALLTENIERAKHGDLIGEFDRLTRQNRLLGKAFHNKLRSLYELRQDADYGNTYVKERAAQQAVAEAERFVVAAQGFCEQWLGRQGPAEGAQPPEGPGTARSGGRT